ncbi:MAG: hypothetical protein COB83_11880, partial [Gammaproteobacteria bacterium]
MQTISEVAKKSGLGRTSIYKALAQDSQPRFDTIQKIVSALGYKFFGAYLSDLGRVHSFAGLATPITACVYAMALGFMGIGTVIFFIKHRHLVPSSNRILVRVTTGLGIVSGLGYVAISITPWDLFPALHLTTVFT